MNKPNENLLMLISVDLSLMGILFLHSEYCKNEVRYQSKYSDIRYSITEFLEISVNYLLFINSFCNLVAFKLKKYILPKINAT